MHELVQDVVNQLDQLSDPERIEKAKINYATTLIVKGVKVPAFRPIVRFYSAKFKKSPPGEVLEFAKMLNATRILEAQQIGFEILDKHKPAKRSLGIDDLLELGEGLDNWVSTDNFAVLLAGYTWREGQISDEIVEKWATSDDKWWRRAAVASTISLNQKSRGGFGDVHRTLKICRLVATDKDDMIAKAVSWSLRELTVWDSTAVTDFINRNETILHKRVIREVRRKIDTGLKS